MENVKAAICYGETKNKLKEFLNSIKVKNFLVETLEEATEKAYEISEEGDVILLSPACASWDQFKDFEERGKKFKEIVSNLVD